MIARPSVALTIDSPSPTTISYSVSNKRHPKSKLVARLRATARVVLISYAILIDLAKAKANIDLRYASDYIDLISKFSLTNPLVQLAASYVDWWILAVLTVITLYVCLRRNYTGRSHPQEALGIVKLMRTQRSHYSYCVDWEFKHLRAPRTSSKARQQHSSPPLRFKTS